LNRSAGPNDWTTYVQELSVELLEGINYTPFPDQNKERAIFVFKVLGLFVKLGSWRSLWVINSFTLGVVVVSIGSAAVADPVANVCAVADDRSCCGSGWGHERKLFKLLPQ